MKHTTLGQMWMDVVAFWKPQLQVSVGLVIATSNDVGLGI
jgi:hypothetical protein